MSVDLSWLKRAHLAVRKATADCLAEYGLTASQLEVLALVAQANGIEHRALLDTLGVTSPTLTSIIDGLVARGYIERRLSPEDARVKLLYLTKAGQQLWRQVDQAADKIFVQISAGFSSGEITLLVELLERLARSASKVSHKCKQRA